MHHWKLQYLFCIRFPLLSAALRRHSLSVVCEIYYLIPLLIQWNAILKQILVNEYNPPFLFSLSLLLFYVYIIFYIHNNNVAYIIILFYIHTQCTRVPSYLQYFLYMGIIYLCLHIKKKIHTIRLRYTYIYYFSFAFLFKFKNFPFLIHIVWRWMIVVGR